MFRFFKKILPKRSYRICRVCALKATHQVVISKELRTIDGEILSVGKPVTANYCDHHWSDEYE